MPNPPLMPAILAIVATAMVLPAFARAQADAAKPDRVYELRIYTCNEGKLPDLNKRFREHSVAMLAKHGMESIFYGTVSEGAAGDDAKNTLIYILAHKN